MRIYPLYEEIIIAVVSYTYGGQKKQVLHVTKVVKILQDVFRHLPKYRVIVGGKAFLARDSFDDLPLFDVVVTGNVQTVHRMEELGVKVRYVARSKGLPGWSGKELRGALEWKGGETG